MEQWLKVRHIQGENENFLIRPVCVEFLRILRNVVSKVAKFEKKKRKKGKDQKMVIKIISLSSSFFLLVLYVAVIIIKALFVPAILDSAK